MERPEGGSRRKYMMSATYGGSKPTSGIWCSANAIFFTVPSLSPSSKSSPPLSQSSSLSPLSPSHRLTTWLRQLALPGCLPLLHPRCVLSPQSLSGFLPAPLHAQCLDQPHQPSSWLRVSNPWKNENWNKSNLEFKAHPAFEALQRFPRPVPSPAQMMNGAQRYRTRCEGGILLPALRKLGFIWWAVTFSLFSIGGKHNCQVVKDVWVCKSSTFPNGYHHTPAFHPTFPTGAIYL